MRDCLLWRDAMLTVATSGQICFIGDVEALKDTNHCLEKDATSLRSGVRDMEAAQLVAVHAGKQLKKRAKHAEYEAARLSDELEKTIRELTAGVTLRDQLQDEITLLQMQVYQYYYLCQGGHVLPGVCVCPSVCLFFC